MHIVYEFDMKVYITIITIITISRFTSIHLSSTTSSSLVLASWQKVKFNLQASFSTKCLRNVKPHWMEWQLVVLLPEQVCLVGACPLPQTTHTCGCRVCLRAPGASAFGMFPHRLERQEGAPREGTGGRPRPKSPHITHRHSGRHCLAIIIIPHQKITSFVSS